MATVQSTIRMAQRALLRSAAADRGLGPQRPSPSGLQTLACAGRKLLGVLLLLLALLMISTLLLMPVGLPLALVAVAMIAAPGIA